MKHAVQWVVRRSLWDALTIVKFRANKPVHIPIPTPLAEPLQSVPLRAVFPSIAIDAIPFSKSVPADEASPSKRRFYDVQMWLAKRFGLHLPDLPEVDPDPAKRLAEAYRPSKQALFPAPQLPDAFAAGEPDLGALALAGPYYGYLTPTADGRWEWDLRGLGAFEHRPEVHNIGARVVFDRDPERRGVKPVSIECELGHVTPQDPQWPKARAIALCALTTHCGLVRHFNGVHLTFGSALAITMRNGLPTDHPLLRLMWPHFFGTQYSNEMATFSQLDPAGDFPQVYSFTLKGLYDLFETSYRQLKLADYDPIAYHAASGFEAAGIVAPSADDLNALYRAFEAHARAYIDAYYPTDADLAADAPVAAWLDAYEAAIPNGLPDWARPLTRETLVRLLAVIIYIVVVEHELRGTFLWNYQLWTHVHPVRVYRDGRREPIDLYQRLVNCNMTLSVVRADLNQDFAYLALDQRGADAFHAFARRLKDLQTELADEPRHVWKLYPDMLNANMNA